MTIDLDALRTVKDATPPVAVEPPDPYPYTYAYLADTNSLVMAVGTVGEYPVPEEPTPPAVVATGATAGTPGSWTPADATEIPADAAGAGAITASPATAWTTGQYVSGSAADMYWDGAAWVAGQAP